MRVGYYLRWATWMETKRQRDKEREAPKAWPVPIPHNSPQLTKFFLFSQESVPWRTWSYRHDLHCNLHAYSRLHCNLQLSLLFVESFRTPFPKSWVGNCRGALIQNGKLRPMVQNLAKAELDIPKSRLQILCNRNRFLGTSLSKRSVQPMGPQVSLRQKLAQFPSVAARSATALGRIFSALCSVGLGGLGGSTLRLEAQSASPRVPFSSLPEIARVSCIFCAEIVRYSEMMLNFAKWCWMQQNALQNCRAECYLWGFFRSVHEVGHAHIRKPAPDLGPTHPNGTNQNPHTSRTWHDIVDIAYRSAVRHKFCCTWVRQWANHQELGEDMWVGPEEHP